MRMLPSTSATGTSSAATTRTSNPSRAMTPPRKTATAARTSRIAVMAASLLVAGVAGVEAERGLAVARPATRAGLHLLVLDGVAGGELAARQDPERLGVARHAARLRGVDVRAVAEGHLPRAA